ncbi:MAG: hypothetical protein AAB605_03660 [Patescibacteria group bacterium]
MAVFDGLGRAWYPEQIVDDILEAISNRTHANWSKDQLETALRRLEVASSMTTPRNKYYEQKEAIRACLAIYEPSSVFRV